MTTVNSIPKEQTSDCSGPLLKVDDLRTTFKIGRKAEDTVTVQAVRGVGFELNAGETVGVVGESGSGKSVTAMSLISLLPPTATVKADVLALNGESIAQLAPKQLRGVRGKQISMVFQDPMTSLNPLMTVGKQIEEMIGAHEKLPRAERKKRVLELLSDVRIPEPEKRYNSYPHEFSGGMRQRVVIAMAMALRPSVLIADEPTTALDVTIQDQILRLMKRMQGEFGTSIILITHDLAVVAGICDRVIVMYGGLVMEEASTKQLFEQPMHPYTMGPLNSLPSLHLDRSDRLESIPGSPPDMTSPPPGCPFAPRCVYARKHCEQVRPGYYQVAAGHRSMCWLLDPDAPDTDNPFGPADGALRKDVVKL